MAARVLNHDAEGFLSGNPIDLKVLLDQWKEIKADTASIRKDLASIVKALKSPQKPVTPRKVEKNEAKSIVIATPKISRSENQETKGLVERQSKRHVKAAVPQLGPKRQSKEAKVALTVAPSGKTLPAVEKVVSNRGVEKLPKASEKSAVTPKQVLPKPTKPDLGNEDSAVTRKTEVAVEKIADKVEKLPKTFEKQVETPQRDSKGRFIGKNGLDYGVNPDHSMAAIAISGFTDRVESAIKDLGDVGEADPAVQAMQEIATPLSKGWDLISGGKSSEEGWLKKIFKSLTTWRKEDSVYNKAVKKELKEIKEKPAGASSNDSGFLGGLGAFGGFLRGPLRLLAGLSKKIPIIGSVLAGLKGIFDFFDNENSSDDRATKDKRGGGILGKMFGTIGGLAGGAKLGGLIGSIFGPVGTAIGATIGSLGGAFFGSDAGKIIGEKIGEFVTWIRNVDWDGLTKAFKKVWDGATKFFTDIWDGLTKAFKKVWDSTIGKLAKKFGFGSDEKSATTENSDNTGFVAKSTTTTETTTGTSPQFIESGVEGSVDGSQGGSLGWISRKFESGGRGAGTISTGNGDFGGASYGSHQLSSKSGTLQKFLRRSGYGVQFEGLVPGTPEFNARWKQIARTDGANFEAAQEKFIKETHFDPAHAMLKGAGVDLTKRGNAVQEALFSTSTQFGAKGASNLFKNALAGQDVNSLSDAQIVSAIQNYKIANNDRLFSKSSRQVRSGTLRRAYQEKELLLAQTAKDKNGVSPASLELGTQSLTRELTPTKTASPNVPKDVATVSTAPMPVAVSAPITAPATPSTPQIPKVEKLQAVETPLATSGKTENAVTVNLEGDAGQDLRDRTIAHIVTGGLGGD